MSDSERAITWLAGFIYHSLGEIGSIANRNDSQHSTQNVTEHVCTGSRSIQTLFSHEQTPAPAFCCSQAGLDPILRALLLANHGFCSDIPHLAHHIVPLSLGRACDRMSISFRIKSKKSCLSFFSSSVSMGSQCTRRWDAWFRRSQSKRAGWPVSLFL